MADMTVANTAVTGTAVTSNDAPDATYYARQGESEVGAAVPAAITDKEDCVENEVTVGTVLNYAVIFSKTCAAARLNSNVVRLQTLLLKKLKQLQLRAKLFRLQQEIKKVEKTDQYQIWRVDV